MPMTVSARDERDDALLTKPNLLVIIADDLGYADLSSYGCPHIDTPNLDRLAASGIRFTHGYAGSATCSPTRISFYTGQIPGRFECGLYEPLISGQGKGLPGETPTLASELRELGYSTTMLGKWHCGTLPDFSPLKSGWDEFFGNFAGGIDYFSKVEGRGSHDLYEGHVTAEDLRYYTHILRDRAIAHIEAPHEKPWLLNLNFTTPHWPWEGPEDVEVSRELTHRVQAGERRALRHDDGGSLETYIEMVEDLDASVGTVMDALERSGEAERTVVLFFSDNGGERYSYHWPLRGMKFSLLEGGIRVPTFISWPGAIPPGVVSDEPVVTMDWHTTLLALAGGSPARRGADGTDLTPHLLHGERLLNRDVFWRTRGYRALRRGAWKYYAEVAADGEVQEALYDLTSDPRECADRSRAEPEVMATLREAWIATDGTLLRYPA